MTQAPGNPPASPEAGWPWAATVPRRRRLARAGAVGLSAGQPIGQFQHDDVVELAPLLRREYHRRQPGQHRPQGQPPHAPGEDGAARRMAWTQPGSGANDQYLSELKFHHAADDG